MFAHRAIFVFPGTSRGFIYFQYEENRYIPNNSKVYEKSRYARDKYKAEGLDSQHLFGA